MRKLRPSRRYRSTPSTENAIDPFAKDAGQEKPNFSRHQYGVSVGGPVIKDKLHFFEAAEALQNNLYDNVVVRGVQVTEK